MATDSDEVVCSVCQIHEGEEGDGPLVSTDLFLTGRGVSLLVNVPAGMHAVYSCRVDGEQRGGGYVGERPKETK